MINIRLIVGLANPGPEYALTRHNAGAWYINSLAKYYNQSLREESKFFGLTGRLTLSNHDIRLLVPTTFMNLSGKSVAAMAAFYQIPVDEILVAHDELAIPPGTARLKSGGSNGGHHGLDDIVQRLADNSSFYRLRIGIGHPGDRNKVTRFVLNRPTVSEQTLIDSAIDEAVHCTALLLNEGMVKAMNQLHAFKATL